MSELGNITSSTDIEKLKKLYYICIAVKGKNDFNEVKDLLLNSSVILVQHGTLKKVFNKLRRVRFVNDREFKRRKERYQETVEQKRSYARQYYKKNKDRINKKRRKRKKIQHLN